MSLGILTEELSRQGHEAIRGKRLPSTRKSKHEHLSQEHTRHVHRQVKTQYDRCAGKGGLGKSGVKEASGWVTLDTGT